MISKRRADPKNSQSTRLRGASRCRARSSSPTIYQMQDTLLQGLGQFRSSDWHEPARLALHHPAQAHLLLALPQARPRVQDSEGTYAERMATGGNQEPVSTSQFPPRRWRSCRREQREVLYRSVPRDTPTRSPRISAGSRSAAPSKSRASTGRARSRTSLHRRRRRSRSGRTSTARDSKGAFETVGF